MDLGNAIKAVRKKKGFTQKQLADLCNLSANSICSIESGQSFPSKATIKKVCEALNVPEAYLLLFSIREEDLPEDKKILYRTLCEPFKQELIRDLE